MCRNCNNLPQIQDTGKPLFLCLVKVTSNNKGRRGYFWHILSTKTVYAQWVFSCFWHSQGNRPRLSNTRIFFINVLAYIPSPLSHGWNQLDCLTVLLIFRKVKFYTASMTIQATVAMSIKVASITFNLRWLRCNVPTITYYYDWGVVLLDYKPSLKHCWCVLLTTFIVILCLALVHYFLNNSQIFYFNTFSFSSSSSSTRVIVVVVAVELITVALALVVVIVVVVVVVLVAAETLLVCRKYFLYLVQHSTEKSPVSLNFTHHTGPKTSLIHIFDNLHTDSVLWFSSPLFLNILWRFHLHTHRNSCNSSHSKSISTSITSSSFDSNSTSTSSNSTINILPFGQLNKIPPP